MSYELRATHVVDCSQLNVRRSDDFALLRGRAGRPSLHKKNYGSLN